MKKRGMVLFWGKDIDNKYRSLRQLIKRIGDRIMTTIKWSTYTYQANNFYCIAGEQLPCVLKGFFGDIMFNEKGHGVLFTMLFIFKSTE